jgi:hypothetical protein
MCVCVDLGKGDRLQKIILNMERCREATRRTIKVPDLADKNLDVWVAECAITGYRANTGQDTQKEMIEKERRKDGW